MSRSENNRKKKIKSEFEHYVRNSSDSLLALMLEIADLQKGHPDHPNRYWSGSPHDVPFLEVLSILDAEKRRRGFDGKREQAREDS